MNPDDFKEAAWEVLTKQEIPGVQDIIRRLYPLLETWWLRAIENALYRGNLLLGVEEITAAPLREIDALSGRTPDGRQRFEIEAMLTQAYMRAIEEAISSFSAEVAEKVQEEIVGLILYGAAFWKLPGGAQDALSAALLSGAFEDIEALVAGRVGSRRGEILSAVRRLVTETTRGLGIEETYALLRDLLGLTTMKIWLGFSLDMWGYRWFNISSVDDAARRGYRFFRVFNNPPTGPDSRTTPFCAHVHGNVLSLDEINLRVERYNNAVLRRDYNGMETAWPLLTGTDANDTGETAGAHFDRDFRRLGLPPYHPLCRTVVQPIRRSAF